MRTCCSYTRHGDLYAHGTKRRLRGDAGTPRWQLYSIYRVATEPDWGRTDAGQDAIAAIILEEILDDRRWDDAFARSQDQLGRLSRDEKLAALDLIWQDLATDAQSFASPDWHAKIIANRLENPRPGQALALVEAKAEIREALDARRAAGGSPP